MKSVVVPSEMHFKVPSSPEDHTWLVEVHNDPAVLHNLTHPEPITLEQHMKWWQSIHGSTVQHRVIFMVNDQRVGFAKIYDVDQTNKNCTLGADIHQDYRGKGYAKFLWTLLLQTTFEKMQLHRVGLTTAEYNKVGQRVYRNLGFKEEGRLVQSLCRGDRYWDQICMYMLREDWEQSNE